MILDLQPQASAAAMEAAAGRPLIDNPATAGEAFRAAFEEQVKVRRSYSHDRNIELAQNEIADDFRKKTGEDLVNAALFRNSGLRAFDKVRERINSVADERPELGIVRMTDEEISARALKIAKTALERRQLLERRPGGGGWSAFGGDAVGIMTDPINIASMMFGFGAGGVVKTALTEGAIAMGSETLIQGLTFDYQRQVDPDRDIEAAAMDVLAAGFGGAVFGGGVRAAASFWTRARTGKWPRHVRDAGNVVNRQAAVANPPVRTVPGQVAHRNAVARAAEDFAQSRPVELPQTALPGLARPGRVYTAEGASIDVSYEIVEASSLVTSHGDDFRPNPSFPQELQPRARERPISQDQINAMSGQLQPERLGPSAQAESGAPIVGDGNLVESGNARTMAIRNAYRRNDASAENYRNFLKSQGHDISGFQEPVLIARRITPLDDEARARFVLGANRPSTLRLSATEQALADARHVDDDMLRSLETADLTAAANRPFVRSFLSKLPRTEQGALIDADGNLSAEGVRRMNAALAARAYGDASLIGRMFEDTDSNMRAIGNALGEAAPAWSRMRAAVQAGRIPAGMDITEDLLQAVRLVQRSRDMGEPFANLLGQAEMFGGPSEVAKLIGRFLFKNGDLTRPASQKSVGAMLKAYAEEAEKNIAGARLIGEPLGTEDVLNTALRSAGREDLAGSIRTELTPEKVDELAAAPETADQMVMDVDRLRAERLTGEVAAEPGPIVTVRESKGLLWFEVAPEKEFGVPGGQLTMSHPAPGIFHIGTSSLREDLRGRGLGLAMYQKAIGYALERGAIVHSDPFVSVDAARVYESLSRRGYTVEKDPAARLMKRKTRDNWVSENTGTPVFKVTAGPNGPPGRAVEADPKVEMKLPIVKLDDAGNEVVEYRDLNELMDEADEEIKAGEQIELCITGAAVKAAE